MIYHIFWGTAGNAGLYMNEIYECLESAGIKQEVFVNTYYPFNYGHKVFFRLTEMGHGKKLGKLRNPVRLIELIGALTRIYFSILWHKPQIVNYSLIGVFSPVVLFLKLIKKTTKSKLIITCHDVMPFTNTIQTVSKQEKMRKECFHLADYLLVHNQNSANELQESFGINPEKIVKHPFPIMDMNKIYTSRGSESKRYDFLFIGHLRKEKGIEVLLEAWKLFHPRHPEATLCIAGTLPFGLDTSRYEGLNITFILHFLSDEEYFTLPRQSNYIILPYTSGTNSGVVSTLITTKGVRLITSDLSMFTSNPLLNKEYMFESGNCQALAKKMEQVYGTPALDDDTTERIQNYRKKFNQEVISVYRKFI